MKIGLQTWGSHGDIRPFLALAEGLQRAGHRVTLVITSVDSDAYARHVSPAGVEIRVVASPSLPAEEAWKIGDTVLATRNPLRQLMHILQLCFTPVEEAMYLAAQRLCEECDVVIGHFLMYPLRIAAERAGRPCITVMLAHGAVPGAHYHPMHIPGTGKAGNRLLWRLSRWAIDRALLPDVNRLRARAALPPVSDMIDDVWLSPVLTLVAASPLLAVPQPDWPDTVHVSGFLDMPNIGTEGTVPPNLAAFIAAGAPPVYMTLGSWMPQDSEGQAATLRLLTQAARKAGCRAIIQSHDAGACGFTSGDGILYVAMAPHQAIFPYCRAIVHHGGAGTTQAAALAGKPSIVVAHIGEQEHWAIELRRVGIGVRRLHRRSVTPASLARRIRQACAAPQMAQRAAQIGAAMRQEDGVAEAVRLIAARFGAHLPAGEAAALIP